MKLRRVDRRYLDAQVIFERACELAGVGPEFRVNLRNRSYSTGVATGSWHVRVTLGHDAHEMERVIVHEVAHTAMPSEHHSPKFYAYLFDLADRMGLDMVEMVRSEQDYKPRNSARAARKYLRRSSR